MSHGCGHLFPLEVRQGGEHKSAFITSNRLIQTLNIEGTNYTFTIEPGFKYDLASVPRWLHWLIGPNDLCWVASLVHDALYRYKGDLNNSEGNVSPPHVFTKEESDDAFFILMKMGEVPTWKRTAAYLGVLLFGRGQWED